MNSLLRYQQGKIKMSVQLLYASRHKAGLNTFHEAEKLG
jgi:hypothetical protein